MSERGGKRRNMLFRAAAMEEGKSLQMADLAAEVKAKLTALMSDLNNKASSYESDVRQPAINAKQELDAIKQLIGSNDDETKQAADRLLTLLGMQPSQPEQMPAKPSATSEPQSADKQVKNQVDKANENINSQMGDLRQVLEQGSAAGPRGGESKMPTGNLTLGDIIKMAVEPSPQLSPPASPAAPSAAPVPGASAPGAAPAPPPAPGASPAAATATPSTLRLKGIATILGDPKSLQDDSSTVALTRATLDLVGKLVDADLDNGLIEGKEQPVVGVRSAADKIAEQSLTINQALDKAVDALRNLCSAVESSDVAASAKSLSTRISGLKDYLEQAWPKKEDVETPEDNKTISFPDKQPQEKDEPALSLAARRKDSDPAKRGL